MEETSAEAHKGALMLVTEEAMAAMAAAKAVERSDRFTVRQDSGAVGPRLLSQNRERVLLSSRSNSSQVG